MDVSINKKLYKKLYTVNIVMYYDNLVINHF